MTTLRDIPVAQITFFVGICLTLFQYHSRLIAIYNHNLLDIAICDHLLHRSPIGLNGSALLIVKNPISDNNERYCAPQPHNVGARHIDISLVFCHKKLKITHYSTLQTILGVEKYIQKGRSTLHFRTSRTEHQPTTPPNGSSRASRSGRYAQ